MSYPFYGLCIAIILKLLLTKYKVLEKYAAFIISISIVMVMTEKEIYISPKEFKLSHISIAMAGFHEYYNVSMLTD